MSSTIFIAVQCCQCSTMQVKQRKKSSYKWNCAVCNEKQSVRKVFAQGFIAKDIRKFVQNFNMSRKSVDDGEWLLAETLDPSEENGEGGLEFPLNQTKKRNDWSAYLDQEDHHIKEGEQEQELNGDDSEPQIVTELQKGMFKKPKLKDNSTFGLGTRESSHKFFKPLFSNSQGEKMKDQRRALSRSSSEWNDNVTPDNHRTQSCKVTTISRAASKWNDYVIEDNGNNLELGWSRAFIDPSGPWNNSVLVAMTSEQRVEDDIHPDFL